MKAISGISRAFIQVDLGIRTYEGRVKDTKTRDEVTEAKASRSKRAASVFKNLFAECPQLDAIKKLSAQIRQYHYRNTTPWSDNGTRLLNIGRHQEYCRMMNTYEGEFKHLVDIFLDKYDTLVAAAAFQLGDLFDRNEYLTRDQVRRKFSIDIAYVPLPSSGDFRLDIESEVQQDLINYYEKTMQDRLNQANKDTWEKLHNTLTHMSDRLAAAPDGKRKIFHDSMLDNAEELCELLTSLNVAGDPNLELARKQLQEALVGITTKELRTADGARVEVKSKVDAILSQFDWGSDE